MTESLRAANGIIGHKVHHRTARRRIRRKGQSRNSAISRIPLSTSVHCSPPPSSHPHPHHHRIRVIRRIEQHHRHLPPRRHLRRGDVPRHRHLRHPLLQRARELHRRQPVHVIERL